MACFLVPAAEAIATSAAAKAAKKKEAENAENESAQGAELRILGADGQSIAVRRTTFIQKLHWLSYMLWGGAALLAFEHVWHGEVTPWFPFLTNAADPADRTAMFHEMATTGVLMAVLVTVAWALLVIAVGVIERRVLRAAGESA